MVVDDHEPFRQLLCSVLQERADLRVIAQAMDGMEAIHTAEELQPDLIILDIGLPKLNGIEAAREIRTTAPKSKIVFLSQYTDTEIVRSAMHTGARGYVVKSDAGTELLEAVNAINQDGRFISSRVRQRLVAELTSVSRRSCQSGDDGPAQRRRRHDYVHKACFYSDESVYLDALHDFVAPLLNAGDAIIVVADEARRNNLLLKLQASGLDTRSAIQQGRYVAVDVAETLSTFMGHDLPDPVQFSNAVGDLLARCANAGGGKRARVAACGDVSRLLLAQGKPEAAVRLERLWDIVATEHDVDVLCAYPLLEFLLDYDPSLFQRICGEHSTVYSQ